MAQPVVPHPVVDAILQGFGKRCAEHHVRGDAALRSRLACHCIGKAHIDMGWQQAAMSMRATVKTAMRHGTPAPSPLAEGDGLEHITRERLVAYLQNANQVARAQAAHKKALARRIASEYASVCAAHARLDNRQGGGDSGDEDVPWEEWTTPRCDLVWDVVSRTIRCLLA